ncbi:MAG: MBL fold metallo-hydrolase [Ignavibacterium sp.]
MKIGKYQLHILNLGYFALDGGAMFGIIPKPLWQKNNPADEQNRIQLATRSLLLISNNRKILIDTGMGNKWDIKNSEIYKIRQDEFSIEKSLSKLNLSVDDITDVFLTHLHFDHTGGSTTLENNKLLPTFPNAKYYVQKNNYDWGIYPSEKDKGSYIQDNFVPLFEYGVLNFLNNDEKYFDDELEIVICNGHTFGQQFLKVSDGLNTIFYSGDLFPTSSHIHLPYIMAYDVQPLITLQEKKEILQKAVEEDWFLFYEHDPLNALSKVKLTEKGFRADELKNEF